MDREEVRLPKIATVSLSQAIKPLLVVSRLVGLNPKTYWQKIYTVFILLCALLLLRVLWQFNSTLNLGSHRFNLVVYVLEDVCRTLSILVIFISTFFNAKRYMVPIKAFTGIDESLKNLGAYIDNKAIHRLAVSLVIYIGLLPFFLGLLEFGSQAAWTNIPVYRIAFFLHYSYNWTFTTVCAMTDCIFIISLTMIKIRFEQINSIIRQAGNRGLYSRIKFLQLASERTDNDLLGVLKIMRKQCHNLWLIVNQLNEDFGPHLLAGVVTSLCLLTIELWSTYFTIKSQPENLLFIIIGSSVWAGYYLLKILLLAKTCESTITEGKTTAIVLQELGMKEDQILSIKREIQDFSTQLQLEAQNFNACKFFDINFKLVCGVLSATCTYLVILIQMDQPNVCATAAEADNSSESHL